jgi:hypothetical protein
VIQGWVRRRPSAHAPRSRNLRSKPILIVKISPFQTVGIRTNKADGTFGRAAWKPYPVRSSEARRSIRLSTVEPQLNSCEKDV